MKSLEISIKVSKIFRKSLKATKDYEHKLLESAGLLGKEKLDYFQKRNRVALSKKVVIFKKKTFRFNAKAEGINPDYIIKLAGYEV